MEKLPLCSFAREGAKVFAVDINPSAAEETKAIINAEGGRCAISATDVSKASDVKAMVEICLETYGRIDILHNNVGIVEVGGCVEASEESWNHVNDVNLKSVFLTCKFVLPHMETQGGGTIVNISSIASHTLAGSTLCFLQCNQGRHKPDNQEHCHTVREEEHPAPTPFSPVS